MKKSFFCKGLISLALFGIVTTVGAASVNQEQVVRPEGTMPATVSHEELLSKGEQLWNDPNLGNSKLACSSCHKNNVARFKKTFLEPYPHMVKMAKKKAKLDEVSAEGMVQLCMVVPMKSEPLPWNSVELAALTTYMQEVVQADYITKKGPKDKN